MIANKVVNFQGMASKQGAHFEKTCILALEMAGFDVTHRSEWVYFRGQKLVEIDAIAMNRHGISFPWEFTGSWNTSRAGMMRTDTVKKKLINAHMLQYSDEAPWFPPLSVMTSHMPTSGASLTMIQAVPKDVLLACLTDKDQQVIQWLVNADEDSLQEYIAAA